MIYLRLYVYNERESLHTNWYAETVLFPLFLYRVTTKSLYTTTFGCLCSEKFEILKKSIGSDAPIFKLSRRLFKETKPVIVHILRKNSIAAPIPHEHLTDLVRQ